MAEKDTLIKDGFSLLPDGMNSGIDPQLLPKTQTAFSTNATHRGGVIKNRPGVRKVTLDFGGDALLQQRFENSIWQGGMFFKSEYGTESLVVSIGGRLLEVVPNPDTKLNKATVYDRTITSGGVDDTNSSGNPIAWLWQAERWAIINDGQSLPIFFDGAVSRRSLGDESIALGTVSIDFTVPAIGSSVDITLGASYAGPVNQTIYIDGTFYQVNSSASGFLASLKNLSEPTATSESAESQLLIPSNLLSQTTQLQASGTFGSQIVVILDLADTPSPALTMGEILTARVSGTNYVSAPIVNIISPTRVMIGPVNSGTIIQKYAPVYRGYFLSSGIAGILDSAFISAAIGSQNSAALQSPYNGVLPQKVVINGGLFEIESVNNTGGGGVVINVTNVNDTPGGTRGPTGTAGRGNLSTIPELPVGKMGAYGMGRNWEALADGRSFLASDIVGGSSGSPALSNRDSVLKVTENQFLFGGGNFVVPGNVGDIQSMSFTANLDVSLGQGPLQVGTPTTIFSCQSPVDNLVWQTITNPILTESLKGKGPLGQYGTIQVNSDTIFRAIDGLGSLILARREFTSHGNTPISREMQRVIDVDNVELLGNTTAVEFDNRVLVGCLPFRGPLGVYHQGIIALNEDPVSSLRGKAPEIYDGLWTGLQVFQLISGKFSGNERAFAFCFETFTNKIVLMELAQSGEEEFDNGSIPITWSFESPFLFRDTKVKGLFDDVELMDGEIWISDIQGIVHVESWYRPDYSECWVPWKSFTVCGTPNKPKQLRRRVGLGQPNIKDCDPTNDQPYRIGTMFQTRFQITGTCKVRGVVLIANRVPERKWAELICDPLCDVVNQSNDCEECKEQGSCLSFDMVFYNLNGNKTYSNQPLSFEIECPDGTTETVIVPAGTVNFTLPFPPDYTGEYPPLVLGCQTGGNIAAAIPSGATQDQIDEIVNGMISQCAEAIAVASVKCQGAKPLFKNEEVFFVHHCETGTLTFNSVLPSWITFDGFNERLVGAANVFQATSQSEANEIAQQVLNDFGNAALTSGDLSCTTDCPTPGSFPTISLPALTQVGGSFALNTTTNTLWVHDTRFTNRVVYVVDLATNAVIQTIDTETTYGGVGQIIYDSVNEQMVAIARNGDLLFINPVTYAIDATIAGLLHSAGVNFNPLAYDADTGNILAVDVLYGGIGLHHVRLVSGATRSQINANDQATKMGSPVYMKGFGQFAISFEFDSTLRYINPTTLIFSATVISLTGIEYMRNGLWVESLGYLFCATYNGAQAHVRIVQPSTDSVVGILTGADVNASVFVASDLVYDSCDNLLWVAASNDGYFSFDPLAFTQQSFVSASGSDAIAFTRLYNLTYIGNFNSTTIITA